MILINPGHKVDAVSVETYSRSEVSTNINKWIN